MRDDKPGAIFDVGDTVGVDSTLPHSYSVSVETVPPQIDFDELPTSEYLVRSSVAGKSCELGTPRVENLDGPLDVPRQDRMSQTI